MISFRTLQFRSADEAPLPPEQNDPLRPRLIGMIDLRRERVKLTARIDWEVFERKWAGFFPSTTGRPATPSRLVAGLLYLQPAFRLSDAAVVARQSKTPIISTSPARPSFSIACRSTRPS